MGKCRRVRREDLNSQDYYQTQYKLQESVLAQRVINQLGWRSSATTASPPAQSSNGWPLGCRNRRRGNRNHPEMGRNRRLISGFLGGLTVEPVRNSRLIKLYHDSPGSQQAGHYPQYAGQELYQPEFERCFDATTYARKFLHERLQQVKVKLRSPNAGWSNFPRQEQIFTVGDKGSIVGQNLRPPTPLWRSGKRRVAAEAMYRQMLGTRARG